MAPGAHPPDEAARAARGRLLAVLATLAALVAMALPALPAPARYALGHPSGESASHLWGLATAARGLGQHGPFLRVSALADAPEGVRLDLVDPLHVLGTWPLEPLLGLPGATLAWNGWHLLSLALLAAGSWRLARTLGATPTGAAVAVAGALGTPYLWAGLPVGRSELLGCLLAPLLLSLLADVAAGRPRAVGRAALVLAAMAWSGWQVLLLCALGLAPAALLLLPRAPARAPARAALRLLAVAALAALVAAPMLAAHLDTAPWWTERLDQAVNLGRGGAATHLPAALRLEGWRPAFDTRVAPYPGAGLVLLALLALGRRPTRRWALLGLALALLALGLRLSLPGGRVLLGPAWPLAAWVPPFGGLTDWARLSLVAGPLLALPAGLLLSRAPPAAAAAVAALLLADGLSFRMQGPGALDTQPPPGVAAAFAALPPGPVVELPGIAPDEKERLVGNDYSLLWALTHGRPVTAVPSPQASTMLGRSMLLNLHRPTRRARDPVCEATEGARLHAMGFRGVVLHTDRLPARTPVDLRARVEDLLGTPAGETEGVLWWALAAGDPGPERCSRPPPAAAPAGERRGGPPPR